MILVGMPNVDRRSQGAGWLIKSKQGSCPFVKIKFKDF